MPLLLFISLSDYLKKKLERIEGNCPSFLQYRWANIILFFFLPFSASLKKIPFPLPIIFHFYSSPSSKQSLTFSASYRFDDTTIYYWTLSNILWLSTFTKHDVFNVYSIGAWLNTSSFLSNKYIACLFTSWWASIFLAIRNDVAMNIFVYFYMLVYFQFFCAYT